MKTISIKERASEFAEDKDVAARIREDELSPAIDRGEKVLLDFEGVTGTTQSFIHAMISGLIRHQGAVVLENLEFAHCNQAVKYIVQIVSEYSQYEIDEEATSS